MPAAMPVKINPAAGRMLRCTRCDTTWFARAHSGEPFITGRGESPHLAARGSGRPRFERIIEHDGPAGPAGAREEGRPRGVAGRLAMGRRLFGAWLGAIAAVGVIAAIAMLAFHAPGLGASPAVERLQFVGFQIRLIRASIERAHGTETVIIVGEIANQGADDKAVPAVRIALLADGAERHAWLHEPPETRLAAGEALTFRSLLPSPPPGVDEVRFHLADRPNMVVGMY